MVSLCICVATLFLIGEIQNSKFKNKMNLEVFNCQKCKNKIVKIAWFLYLGFSVGSQNIEV
jgi:hypothetical protein